MTTWQTPAQEWQAAPPPPWQPPQPEPPAPAAISWPLPPVAAWVAGALAAGTAVLLVVLLALGGVRDLLAEANLSQDDAGVAAAMLGTLAVAGLLAGAAGLLTGRGSGLLRVAGAGVAVLAVLGVVAATIVRQRVDVPELAFGLAVAVAAGTAAGLGALRTTTDWTAAAERRSAERAIARLSAGRTAPVGARSAVSLVLAVLLVLAVVLAGVLAVTSATPDTVADSSTAAAAVAAASGSGATEDAAPLPVQQGDADYSAPLDTLARACAAGNLAGCDALYWASDEFSGYEEYGSTCGGRTTLEYEGTCDDLFD